MNTTNKNIKGLTLTEVDNIVCLIKTNSMKTGYTNSKALLKRRSFPCIAFEHKTLLNNNNIGNCISQFQLNLLEYYDKKVYNFKSFIVPVYYEGKDKLFYKDENETKKIILPTKETLDAAFALVEKVNKLVSQESK